MRITVTGFGIDHANTLDTTRFVEIPPHGYSLNDFAVFKAGGGRGTVCQKGPARAVVPIVVKIDVETTDDDARIPRILDRIRSDLALLEDELNRDGRRPRAEAANPEPAPSRCTACRYFTEGPTASPMCGHPAPVAVRDVNRSLEWVPYWCPFLIGQP